MSARRRDGDSSRRLCCSRAVGVIRKFRGGGEPFRWDGVAVEEYPQPSGRAVTKQVLIGPGDGAAHFALRYFEVAPGGASALDEHAHDHGVAIVRGRGSVLLGDTEHAVSVGDVVYVAPGERHRFRNVGDEPLGFLCIVPPRRR